MAISNQRDVTNFMQVNGFQYKRDCNIGVIWTDGHTNITVSNRICRSPRNIKNLEAQVRRAVRDRPGYTDNATPRAYNPDIRRAAEQKVTIGDLIKAKTEQQNQEEDMHTEPRRILVTPKPEAYAIDVPSPSPAEIAADEAKKPLLPAKPAEEPKARRQLDPDAREKLYNRMKQLYALGGRGAKIAEQMNLEGFRKASGEKIDANYVSMTCHTFKQRGELPERVELSTADRLKSLVSNIPKPAPAPVQAVPPAPAPAPLPPPEVIPPIELKLREPEPTPVAPPVVAAPTPGRLPHILVNVLQDAELSNTEKVAMMEGFLSGGKRKLPEAVVNVLTDPELTENQKVAMVKAYLEA